MHPLSQLANELNRERLAHAEQQRPARRLLAFRRASRRAERAERARATLSAEPLRLRGTRALTPPPASRKCTLIGIMRVILVKLIMACSGSGVPLWRRWY